MAKCQKAGKLVRVWFLACFLFSSQDQSAFIFAACLGSRNQVSYFDSKEDGKSMMMTAIEMSFVTIYLFPSNHRHQRVRDPEKARKGAEISISSFWSSEASDKRVDRKSRLLYYWEH